MPVSSFLYFQPLYPCQSISPLFFASCARRLYKLSSLHTHTHTACTRSRGARYSRRVVARLLDDATQPFLPPPRARDDIERRLRVTCTIHPLLFYSPHAHVHSSRRALFSIPRSLTHTHTHICKKIYIYISRRSAINNILADSDLYRGLCDRSKRKKARSEGEV